MTERQDASMQNGNRNSDGGRHTYYSRVELSGIPFRITDTEEVIALPGAVKSDIGENSMHGTRWINELGEITRS